ncbi:MAG: heme exporter protein CcmB [Bacteroidota bacterium]
MQTIRQMGELLRQELRTEWRDRSTIVGVLLYVAASVVLVYSALNQFSPLIWNALFWVLLFFAAVSSVGRAFRKESGRRHLYWYSLVAPEALLVSKLIYNSLFLFGLGSFIWLLLGLFSGGNPVAHPQIFLTALALGSLGLATTFSFLAAIGMRAGGGATLLTVLAFPLLIPLLFLLVRAGLHSLDPAQAGSDGPFLSRLQIEGGLPQVFTFLLGLDLILLAVALLLFPFVWRD